MSAWWLEEDDDDVSCGGTVDWLPRVDHVFDDHPLQNHRWLKPYLHQGDKWRPASGPSLDIATMDPKHALNSAIYLVKHAFSIFVAMAAIDVDEVSSYGDAPWQYVMATELYRALVRRAGEVEDSPRPW